MPTDWIAVKSRDTFAYDADGAAAAPAPAAPGAASPFTNAQTHITDTM